MSSIITLPGSPETITQGFRQAMEFVLEDFYDKAIISQAHTIIDGIKNRQQIAYVDLFGKTGLADSGCGFTAQNTLNTRQKFWEPVPVEGTFEQCQLDLQNSFVAWANGNGVARKDLSNNSIFMAFIMPYILDTLTENSLRRYWFSDTAYTAGDFTNGATDLPFYNLYDGFFKQIFDSVTAGDIPQVVIPENSAASTTAQLNLASDRAITVFQEMARDIDSRFFQRNDAQILVTRTLYRNYAVYLQSQQTFNSFVRIEDGFTTLMYENIPVRMVDNWDRNIQADFKTGSPETFNLPHRAVMTTTNNLLVGLDNSSSLSDSDMWYSKDDQVWRAQYNTVEDVKIGQEYLVAAAY